MIDIPEVSKSKFKIFADDTSLFSIVRNDKLSQNKLISDLKNWMGSTVDNKHNETIVSTQPGKVRNMFKVNKKAIGVVLVFLLLTLNINCRLG